MDVNRSHILSDRIERIYRNQNNVNNHSSATNKSLSHEFTGASPLIFPETRNKAQINNTSLAMQKLTNIQFSSIGADQHSSTHSDASNNKNGTILNIDNDELNMNNNQELEDVDDVTKPFNACEIELNEEGSKSSRASRKNIFRRIFCCFKTSNVTYTKRNDSKSNTTRNSISSKNKKNSESFNHNSNQYNNSRNGIIQNNTRNIQQNSADDNHITSNNKNLISSSSLKDNESSSENFSNGSNNSIKSETTYRNSDQYNNTNENSNKNDTNNNIMYTPQYCFSNNNDNIDERPLLDPIESGDSGKKCLIIDLDETLVHSSFKQVSNADFIVPVEIDGIVHQVYVLKRPHVDEFLKKMGKLFECVLFTASLAKYADPVADLLDKSNVFKARLFREACVYYRGNYVKDLSRLGRDLNKVIIIDNSPASYIFHPDNAVACTSWFDDPNDTELLDLIPHFEKLASCDSVYSILKMQSNSNDMNNPMMSSNYAAQNNYHRQQPNVIYSQQHVKKIYEESQQVPTQQLQSLIYQQQQVSTNNENSTDYSLNENKILLSIDLMMSKKQQQLQ